MTEPVYVAHGTADRTIGVAHGERVYALGAEQGRDSGSSRVPITPICGTRGIWERAEAFFARSEAKLGR